MISEELHCVAGMIFIKYINEQINIPQRKMQSANIPQVPPQLYLHRWAEEQIPNCTPTNMAEDLGPISLLLTLASCSCEEQVKYEHKSQF